MIAKIFFSVVLIILFALVIYTCTGCTSTCIETPDGHKFHRTSFGQQVNVRVVFDEMGNPTLIEYGNDGGEKASKAVADAVTIAVMEALKKGLVP